MEFSFALSLLNVSIISVIYQQSILDISDMRGCPMKVYQGSRTIDGIKVTVDGAPLDERQDIARFTELGFEWTYEGDSPKQLSLALLADHFTDGEKAIELCAPFMSEIIANLDNDWEMTSADIDAALEKLTRA